MPQWPCVAACACAQVDLSQLSEADVGTALNLCSTVLLDALAAAGVDTAPIFDLVTCPPASISAAQNSCLRLGA